ncbi:MAG: cation:proton antiporter, partial [Candidatus Nealsonbacteria bacterium]
MYKVTRLVLTFFLLMSFWLVLSQNLQPASLLIGALFSFLAALLSYDFFIKPNE